jgi:hypothetical protein
MHQCIAELENGIEQLAFMAGDQSLFLSFLQEFLDLLLQVFGSIRRAVYTENFT